MTIPIGARPREAAAWTNQVEMIAPAAIRTNRAIRCRWSPTPIQFLENLRVAMIHLLNGALMILKSCYGVDKQLLRGLTKTPHDMLVVGLAKDGENGANTGSARAYPTASLVWNLLNWHLG